MGRITVGVDVGKRTHQVITYGRRELVHVHVTPNPTAAWVWRQVIEATPWGQKSRPLLRDRDTVCGPDFRQRARGIGIESIATPVRRLVRAQSRNA
jgi:hypothetical protein